MDSKRTRVSTTINSLPDDVICHILSFLSTVESVRTRVLSTRWKHLFSLVPVLDFEYDYPSVNFAPNPTSMSFIMNSLMSTYAYRSSAYRSSVPAHSVRRFLDFVEWVFNSYAANSMNKFSFKSKRRFKATSRLLSWISKFILLGVQELNISMFFKRPKTLPREVFNCETLTDLKISGNFVLDVPNGVCLPHVKNILLFHAHFVDGGSAGRLFSSCPVLENLFLYLAYTGDIIQDIDVSVPSLKSLTVAQGNYDNYMLVLDVPNLEYLDYTGHVPHGVYVNPQGLKSLTKAFIAFPAHFYNMYDSLEKLFSVICHVPVLRICTWTLEALKRSGRSLPMFHKLTQLEIKVVKITSFDLGFMLHLLSTMPNLEVLLVENDVINNQLDNLFPENVPVCVSLRLKEVRFLGFFMMEHEFKLVEYFLKNAEVLDTLKIESNNCVENRFEISKELLVYPRYSRTCKILLT